MKKEEKREEKKKEVYGQKENKKGESKKGENKKGESKKGESRKEENRKEGNEKEKKGKGAVLCPVSKKCGGCQLLYMDYSRQLKWKKEQAAKLLAPYGKVEEIIGMKDPLHYRCKVHAVFGRDRKGNIISGIYQNGTHKIVPVESCLLEDEKADAIIGTIRGLLKSFKIKVYDEDTGYGLLRHVLVRTGYATGQIMVILVLRSPILPSKNNFVKALLKEHPEITTVVVNVNDRKTSMVLGDRQQVIYGPGCIEDELCGMRFKLSPKAFYQVNPVQAEKLYEKAIAYAGLTGKEQVLDAYCGTGTIGMIASPRAKQVMGVELNRDAVKDAIEGARKNQLSNVRFYQADAGDFAMDMAREGVRVDVVLMDPPRTGSSEKFLEALNTLKPKKIVYVSCNAQTLARDLKYLCDSGYQLKKAAAVDMFPYTDDIEMVCLLSKNGK
ncbi:MAG: 23S rRNA (uracil(1939)-C(5))-methyltransferase RlmD [Lachnospiraceae bacterium]|nr:23S rRNA (uracil(1939)-C(5))-methyltransferase RlmD [Lachnospiraceae bacterium]